MRPFGLGKVEERPSRLCKIAMGIARAMDHSQSSAHRESVHSVDEHFGSVRNEPTWEVRARSSGE